MDNSNLLVGLDIGTTSVKAVVADSGKVIAAVAVPNKGMRHGNIVDIDETAAAINRALKEIAKKTNANIYRVVTGIPVGMLQLETASDLVNISDNGQEVGNHDVRRVVRAAIRSAVKNEREPISFLPSRFLIDGKTEVDDPRKMIAHSLSVQGIMLTGYADPSLASAKNKFAVNSVGSNGQQMVDEKYLSEIINARVIQTIDRIEKGLVKHDALKLPGGIIITGGSSLLQGYDSIIANTLNVKARIYQPDQIGMRNPIYSAAYGVVNYAYKMSEIDFLVISAIYGKDSFGQEQRTVPEKTKTSKRTAAVNETKRKEEYNRHELLKREQSPHSKTKNNMQNKDKGFKNFFKKFFD